MANRNDLRYVRTEQAIRAAFMNLVSQGPVSSVTASAICRQAGISRNAFYLHHGSVASLYAALVGELVADVQAISIDSAERCAATGRDAKVESSIVGALAQHEDLLRALLPPDDGSLAKRLVEGIEEAFVVAALRFGEHGGSLEHRMRCAYSAGAIVGLVSCWISKSDMPLTGIIPAFEELHSSAVDVSTRYLTGR